MYVGWEEGIGIDFATALVLKVVENVGVEGGILFIGEEGEVGDGTYEDVVDAGGGFYSCFTGHNYIEYEGMGWSANLLLLVLKHITGRTGAGANHLQIIQKRRGWEPLALGAKAQNEREGLKTVIGGVLWL